MMDKRYEKRKEGKIQMMLNEKKGTEFRLASRHVLLSIPTHYVARRHLKRKILMCPIVMLTFR